MKSLICIAAVLALAAPLYAANVVTLSATDAGSGQVLITYNVTEGDENPVGMGLKISLTNDATVNDPCDVLETNPQFNTYIDYVADMAEPNAYVLGEGHPLANPDAAGVAPANASVVSVCMGRLTDPPTAADPCGLVIKLQLHQGSAGTTDVTVDADTLRGGVVGSSFTVVPASCTVTFGIDCWVDNKCQPCGDWNGDYLISPADATGLVAAWSPNPYERCADFNHDGIISPADATILVNHWSPNENCPDETGTGGPDCRPPQ